MRVSRSSFLLAMDVLWKPDCLLSHYTLVLAAPSQHHATHAQEAGCGYPLPLRYLKLGSVDPVEKPRVMQSERANNAEDLLNIPIGPHYGARSLGGCRMLESGDFEVC
jgi:hypothetical protein